MLIRELSKELGIENGDLINFLKGKDFKVTSHMQKMTDEMIDAAMENFKKVESKEEPKEEAPVEKKEIPVSTRKFDPNDLIPCKSVVPYKLNGVGADRYTVYHWEYYGDVDYVKYSDLQAWRRKKIVTKPLIIIEDPDLCYQWRRELGDTYKYFIGVDYPEDFFELPDNEFEKLLSQAPDSIKETIGVTARAMINNKNYPSVSKINMIDEILGTCIKEFL